jgi:L-serine dehydratase
VRGLLEGRMAMDKLLNVINGSAKACRTARSKAWTAYCIASEEVPEERRVDLDTTIDAMSLTAKEMNTKYKETSEGRLAVSVVLC